MTLLTDHLDHADRAIAAARGTHIGMLPQTSIGGEEIVRAIEAQVLALPQLEVVTYHVLHGDVYSRTICLPAGGALTSALIRIPTTLTISGDCSVLIGDASEVRITGYRVFAAAANRIQAYIAHADTWMTMSFKTNAKSITEAEEEFTHEADRLFSRRGINEVIIT